MIVTCYGECGSEAIAFLDRLASRVAMQTATSTPEMKNAIYTAQLPINAVERAGNAVERGTNDGRSNGIIDWRRPISVTP